ncbi:ribonuclease E [Lamprobacter modestohalophilus]|uniref:Ribonuclease E n=1 Tax=Lamprobacter modestohalophilus TaxID=1064514 RepID=A0A9X0W8G7_9GAMM|nr:ribonuclease E [Lamprobacter modestohalophilus]
MKRMLINATQPEELRVAIVDGQQLYNLDIESAGREQKKANVYKGTITRVEPSLEAAFVDYGSDRHGFLPLKEIARSYFRQDAPKPGTRASIKELIKEGQQVMVQIDKEERGNKGAALTTFISLAGRYLVLMPNNPRAGGVSRRIEGNDRSDLREVLSQLELPEDMGLIVRTAGVGKNAEELQWDLNYLLQLWDAIKTSGEERKAPFLIYQESDVIIRSMRDHLRVDIGEIVVDDAKVYEKAEAFMRQVMPNNLKKLRLYLDEVPLFTRYQIESQIESVFQREVRLPSGGSLVIDQGEALTAVDINSARATKGADIEETALNTNLEAADEIARQLRLRDLGGLFVIDFIDMTPAKNQREVENRLRDALKHDRARVQVARISRFGLLEMSRQRLRPSLGESSQLVCPRCKGQGTIRGVESLALSVLRIVEEEAMKDRTSRIIAQLPVEVATFLLNEKRRQILQIEERQKVDVVLIPNRHMETPDFEIERIRAQDTERLADNEMSYDLTAQPAQAEPTFARPHIIPRPEEPAVKALAPSMPAPQRPERQDDEQPPTLPTAADSASEQGRRTESVLKRIWSTLFALPNDQPGGASADNHAGAGSEQASGSGPRAHRSGSSDAKSQRADRGRNGSDQGSRSQRGERRSRRSNGASQDRAGLSETAATQDRDSATSPATENDSSPQRSPEEQPQNATNGNAQSAGQSRRSSSRRGSRGGRGRRNQPGTDSSSAATDEASNSPATTDEQSTSANAKRDAAPVSSSKALVASESSAHSDEAPKGRKIPAAGESNADQNSSARSAVQSAEESATGGSTESGPEDGDAKPSSRTRSSRRRRGGRGRRRTEANGNASEQQEAPASAASSEAATESASDATPKPSATSGEASGGSPGRADGHARRAKRDDAGPDEAVRGGQDHNDAASVKPAAPTDSASGSQASEARTASRAEAVPAAGKADPATPAPSTATSDAPQSPGHDDSRAEARTEPKPVKPSVEAASSPVTAPSTPLSAAFTASPQPASAQPASTQQVPAQSAPAQQTSVASAVTSAPEAKPQASPEAASMPEAKTQASPAATSAPESKTQSSPDASSAPESKTPAPLPAAASSPKASAESPTSNDVTGQPSNPAGQ